MVFGVQALPAAQAKLALLSVDYAGSD